MAYNAGPVLLHSGNRSDHCPICDELTTPVWDGADGDWICGQCYSSYDMDEDD